MAQADLLVKFGAVTVEHISYMPGALPVASKTMLEEVSGIFSPLMVQEYVEVAEAGTSEVTVAFDDLPTKTDGGSAVTETVLIAAGTICYSWQLVEGSIFLMFTVETAQIL